MSGSGDDASGGDGQAPVDGSYGRRPDPPPARSAGSTDEDPDNWAIVVHDVVSSVLAVLLVGAYLFAISGIWPPLVAIESGSMEPHMHKNDLVFVMDEARFSGAGAIGDTGVVTLRAGHESDYSRFGNPGDVIVYRPGGDQDETPVIHRAMFWVEKDEHWYERANESYVGSADSCADLQYCPAKESGFITKGDANDGYDQVVGKGANTGVVKPDWVIGTAEFRIPGLGWIRLNSV